MAPATRSTTTKARHPDATSEEDTTVAKLIYMAIASLDGYVADEDGNFERAKP